MEKSFVQYLQEKSSIGMWIKTPRWTALCLPVVNILYFQFGGMMGLLYAAFNLTPTGLLYNVWGGLMALFEGKSFMGNFTGEVSTSYSLLNLLSFDLILTLLFFYFYKKSGKLKINQEKKIKKNAET